MGIGIFDFVVDVGCGIGLSICLFCEYFCYVIGVDVSEIQIKMVWEVYVQINLLFEVSEVEWLMFMYDVSIDLVIVV